MSLGTRFSIDEGFRELATAATHDVFPTRREFRDPLLVTFQNVPLSRLIDQELERHYAPPSAGPVEYISRVFRRLRRSG